MPMKCADCKRRLEPGDRYIKATASEYLGDGASSDFDDIIAMVMGSEAGDEIVYCTNCTVEGGEFSVHTYYGNEGEEDG